MTEILYPGSVPDHLERQYQGMLRLIDDVLSLLGCADTATMSL